MAGKTSTTIPWKDLLKQAATDSGIPQKTLEESANATAATLEKMIRDTRPGKIGETTVIKTPYGAFKTTYNPERTFQNPKTGEKAVRPACYGINIGVPKQMLSTANTGINLEKTPVADTGTKEKKKSA